MTTAEHRTQLEQQITRAWREYVDSCLDHDAGRARLCMTHIDRLLDRLPRQREATP